MMAFLIMDELEQQLSQIAQFAMVHQHLFTSGQPDAAQLQCIKDYGCSTVINVALSTSDPHLLHEDQICLELGLNYIHFPLNWDMPCAEQTVLILDLIQHLVAEQTVWLHCAKNYRVSCLMYLYRQFYLQMPMPEADELLQQIWQPNDTWTGLIHSVNLILQGRQATSELNASLAAMPVEQVAVATEFERADEFSHSNDASS